MPLIQPQNAKICKNTVLKLLVQKAKTIFLLKIMPLPGKFPGDAHGKGEERKERGWEREEGSIG